ncbi:polysaccharide deacetylase [Paenibacillus sp. FSL R10-2734]|uniref:YkoP family protein n=1 Tax=Paenibacillus sp. FSL R10-2734 TaxID=2954691 RepID=UPI0030D8E13F
MMVASVSFIKLFSQSLWMLWENLFAVITKFRSHSVRRYGICKLVVMKYHGEILVCQDGQQILPGDWVGELHLDNRQVVQLTRTLGADRAGIRTARMLREAMKEISRELDSNPELSKVQALTGITLLHRGIIHGIGFEHHPIKSSWQRQWYGIYLRFLLRMLHPEGKQRVEDSTEKLSPMRLVLSKRSLKARFASRRKEAVS